MNKSRLSNNLLFWPLLLCLLFLGSTMSSAQGENIDPDNDGSQYAWGENIGWLNLEPAVDGHKGVEVSDDELSGFIWGENVGWIRLKPSTGGVVNDGDGNLSGLAWGENIGWINFAPEGGGVTVDPCTGEFSGLAWGENIGWINFGPHHSSAKTSWRKDSDSDGVCDFDDNCPLVPNSDQTDGDSDGIGDECDPDDDDDNIPDDGDQSGTAGDNPCKNGNTLNCDDNCPLHANPDQLDSDGDGIGDICDPFPGVPAGDSDGDGIDNAIDNCPDHFNPFQENHDSDPQGDACDPDDDNDGIPDDGDQSGTAGDNPCKNGNTLNCDDNCPLVANNNQDNTDGDDLGNVCDEDDDNDGILDDGDQSGTAGDNPCKNGNTLNCDDNCQYIKNSDQTDSDSNGIGDACEVPGYDPYESPPPLGFRPRGLGIWQFLLYADPVNLATGAYVYSRALLSAPAAGLPFDFSIHYHSASSRTSPVGQKWSHSYHWYVESYDDDTVAVRCGDGSADYFVKNGGAYVPKYSGISSTLSEDGTGGLIYTTRERTNYFFGPDGRLTEIQERNRNSVVLKYSLGQLVRIVDTRGNTATLTYDAEGYLFSVDYAGFQTVSFDHDESGNLAGFMMADGRTTTFAYDEEGRLLTGTRGDGVQFVTNMYDDEHRVVRQQDAKGAESVMVYHDDNTVEVFNRVGSSQTRTYDILGRLVRWEDAAGGVRTFTYDEDSNLTSVNDQLGNTAFTFYDESGNPTKHVDVLGDEVLLAYDEHNNLTSFTDEAGFTYTFTYDSNGNVLTATDPLGHTVTYTYTAQGQLQTVTDRQGNTSSFGYAAEGDLKSFTDALGGVTAYEYDGLGRRIAVTDPNGNRTTFAYDAGGRVRSLTMADGGTLAYTYDTNGQLVKTEDSNGALTQFEFSPTHTITSITDPLGKTYHYTYDEEDRLSARLDPIGRKTVFTRDLASRLSSVTDAWQTTAEANVAATYDATGNRLTLADANGNVAAYEYDARGRIIAEWNPLGDVVRNTYAARSLLSSTTNARGMKVSFEYDAAGQLIAAHLPSHTVTHVLDANGNRLSTVGRNAATIERTFDAMNRLRSRTDEFGNTIRYDYDPAGNLTALTYSHGKRVEYSYDSLNRLSMVTDWADRVTRYDYDTAGNLERATLPDGSIVSYSYNLAGRLTALSDVSGNGDTIYSTQYTLSPAGLRRAESAHLPLIPNIAHVELSFQVNRANQLSSLGSANFSYDADGNMIYGPINGVPTALMYDERDQLVQVGVDTYRYDADGLRIEVTVNDKTVRYVQDPNAMYSRLLEEHDEDGDVIARYVYGMGLISREDAGGTISVYHFDSRGSTVALTNAAGTITDRYAYGPYGKVWARQGTTPNPFTYNGRDGVLDDGNGLYFMRSRYYAPSLMRFVQTARLYRGSLMASQSLNRYSFVEGNPVHRIDPNGYWLGLDDAIMTIGGAIFGVGEQVFSDVVSGEWSGWEDYVGSAIGGAAAAEIILYTANPFLAGAGGGFFGELATQLFNAIPGGNEFDWVDYGVSMAYSTIMGGLLGKFGYKGITQPSKAQMQAWAQLGFRKGLWRVLKGGTYSELEGMVISAFFERALYSPPTSAIPYWKAEQSPKTKD